MKKKIVLSFTAKHLKLGYYKHYKGGIYKVTGVAINSEDLSEMVIYKQNDNNNFYWVRPLSMFVETVAVSGKDIPRFKYLGKAI